MTVGAVLTIAVENTPDLTRASASAFKTNLNQIVTLRGMLEVGMQGYCLVGSTPTNVVFYIIPDMPANGIYCYPDSWQRLKHQKVRVTGKLKYRSFDHKSKDPLQQIPPDYFYMTLQQTSVQRKK